MKPLSLSLSCALLVTMTACKTAEDKTEKAGQTKDSAPAAAATTTAPAAAATAAGASASSAVPNPDAPSTKNWITTASGLQYRVLASGPAGGRSPGLSDTVSVHYRGQLTDGTVFDSSIDRGQPASFGVGQVIPGWTEALQMMKPGDQWVLYIPANIAYGNRAVGGKIPPNSDLIFQVALLQVF